jgi:thiol-disulfide isomerase/thioredoxin
VTRREVLTLGAVAAGAAVVGSIVGAFGLQAAGAAELLSTPFLDLDGRTRRLRDWRGSVLVCNFWATWCAPCREEIPLLRAAKQQWGTHGLEIAGIGVDSAAKIREFAANVGVNYPIFLGDASTIALMRKVGNASGGLPYNTVLDRRGAIAHRKLGAFTAAELRQVVDGLLR